MNKRRRKEEIEMKRRKVMLICCLMFLIFRVGTSVYTAYKYNQMVTIVSQLADEMQTGPSEITIHTQQATVRK